MPRHSPQKRDGSSRGQSATDCLSAIQAFLTLAAKPAVWEHGDQTVPLVPGEFSVELRRDALWIDVWSSQRSLSRRILSVDRKTNGCLDCTIQLFGGKPGKLSFLDLDRPQTSGKLLRGIRSSFAEQFRRMLTRQLPGWDVAVVSSGMDLQRSFSPLFPRARLTRGISQIAAVACPSPDQEGAFLTAALLWHHHLSANTKSEGSTSLALFLPASAGVFTVQRLNWLTGIPLRTRLFRFNDHGSAGEVDSADWGNLSTAVGDCQPPFPLRPDLTALLLRLSSIEGVSTHTEASGRLSIRCRGLEFARVDDGALLYGIETKVAVAASHFQQVEELATQLSTLRKTGPSSGSTPAFLAYPERWLEACVRKSINVVDPSLLDNPVHGQVLTFAGGDRDLIDLLAISREGRLTLLELKAEEDMQLPLQALDYWMRIRRHAELRELDQFFPEMPVLAAPPRILLVAPALCFHPSNEIVLRYFSPEIDVERVGINSGWQQNLRVVLRLKGAELPLCHGSRHEY